MSTDFIRKTGKKFGLDFRNVTDNGDTLSFRHNTNTYTVKKNVIKTHVLQMLSEYYSKFNWTKKMCVIDHAVPNLAPYCLILLYLCINPLKKKHRSSFNRIANLKYDGFIVEDDISTLDICNWYLISNISVTATLRLLHDSETLLEFVDKLHTTVTGKDLLVVYEESGSEEEIPKQSSPTLLCASTKYGFGFSSEEGPDTYADLLIEALRGVEGVPRGYPMLQTSVCVFDENNECIGESTLENIITYKQVHQKYLSLVNKFV